MDQVPHVGKVTTIMNNRLNLRVVKWMTSNNLLGKVATKLNEVDLSSSESGSNSTIVTRDIKELHELFH